MKLFARIAIVSFLALAAAGAELLIVKYRNPISEFLYEAEYSYVPVLQTALMVIGGMIVVAAAALAVARRISRRRRDMDILSDRAVLRWFAVAMLFVWVFCWTLISAVGCDAWLLSVAARSYLVLHGSVVAVRARDKWWILVYLLIWLFDWAIVPCM